MILFAYGANMNPGLMAERCPEFRTLGVARLVDYRLCFPRFSRARNCATAGIEPLPGEAVWGVLYDISPSDVPVLNYHEGYDPDRPASGNRRILREVTVLRMGGSEPMKAMAYFSVPDGTDALPSAAYLQSIIDGAKYHGLPKACIAALEAIRTA
jgi:gamma-glutamylcyclotransferase